MGYRQSLMESMHEIKCTGPEEIPYDSMIQRVVTEIEQLRKRNGSLYFVGNGGSAAIAVHMTGDFLSNGGVRTHSMHDPATMTCLANDFGYAQVFSRQVEAVAAAGDLLVAISSSGLSENILQAVKAARKKKCSVGTFSGFREDNSLRQMGDWNFYVPSMAYGIVESIHNMILQQIVDELLARRQER